MVCKEPRLPPISSEMMLFAWEASAGTQMSSCLMTHMKSSVGSVSTMDMAGDSDMAVKQAKLNRLAVALMSMDT